MSDTPGITDNLLDMYGGRHSLGTRVNLRFFLSLSGLAGIPRESRILDCGCAVGHLLCLLKRAGFSALWGMDASPAMVEKARLAGAGTIIHSEVQALDRHFSASSLDVIIISNLLHHLPDEEEWARLFASCHNILAPAGLLVIREPFPNLPHRLLEKASQLHWLRRGLLAPHLASYETERHLFDYFIPRWKEHRREYLHQAGFSVERDMNWWVHRITTAHRTQSAS